MKGSERRLVICKMADNSFPLSARSGRSILLATRPTTVGECLSGRRVASRDVGGYASSELAFRLDLSQCKCVKMALIKP